MLKILILKKKKYDLYLLFILYLIVLVIGLLFRNVYAQAIELNPFAFVYAFFDNPISIVVTLINIIGFIPAYPIIYCIKRNIKFYKIILAFGLAFLVIEFIQYIFAIGVFSLADIFLYFIGFMLGYWATRFVIATDRNDANELPWNLEGGYCINILPYFLVMLNFYAWLEHWNRNICIHMNEEL